MLAQAGGARQGRSENEKRIRQEGGVEEGKRIRHAEERSSGSHVHVRGETRVGRQMVSISKIRYALKSKAVDPNLRATGGVALM